MYIKQQQRNTQLHGRITSQLDKRLNQPRSKTAAPVLATEHPVVSFRAVWFIVLVSGGFVAILLALLQQQHPNTLNAPLGARSLAYVGLTSIVLGCLGALVRRSHRA